MPSSRDPWRQTNDYLKQTIKVLPDSARSEQESLKPSKWPANGFNISLWIARLMEENKSPDNLQTLDSFLQSHCQEVI